MLDKSPRSPFVVLTQPIFQALDTILLDNLIHACFFGFTLISTLHHVDFTRFAFEVGCDGLIDSAAVVLGLAFLLLRRIGRGHHRHVGHETRHAAWHTTHTRLLHLHHLLLEHHLWRQLLQREAEHNNYSCLLNSGRCATYHTLHILHLLLPHRLLLLRRHIGGHHHRLHVRQGHVHSRDVRQKLLLPVAKSDERRKVEATTRSRCSFKSSGPPSTYIVPDWYLFPLLLVIEVERCG